MPSAGLSLVLAGALLSITLNPLAFAAAERLAAAAQRYPEWTERFEALGNTQLARLQQALDAAAARAKERASARKTLTPQELVDRFPLFAGLNAEQREVVLLHLMPYSANPGDRIIRKGDPADAVYFIASGEVEVSVGSRRIRLGPGNFVGEMGLITGRPRSADVTALDYSTFLKLTQQDFREILRRYPDIRAPIEAAASERDEMNRRPATVIRPAAEVSQKLPPDPP
jgi:CPA2 family monovalent cation:H+ antiporter-2